MERMRPDDLPFPGKGMVAELSVKPARRERMGLLPLDRASTLEGPATDIPADNRATGAGLKGTIVLSNEGALSEMRVPEAKGPAGAPSFLTPALCLARIWLEHHGGQRFVLHDTREAPGSQPCRFHQRVFCRLVRGKASARFFETGAFIFTQQGEDISSLYFTFSITGDDPPPPLQDGEEPLKSLDGISSGHCLIEHAYLPPFAWQALTPFEQGIAAGLAERRKTGFMAARIALKRLARKLGAVEPQVPSFTLETVSREDRLPLLPGACGRYHASVTHDRRFALVVADERPIGVDIEAVTPKLIKAAHIFMDSDELRIVAGAELDPARALTRVWTAKEAASKALNRHLIDTWRAVRLSRLGREESVFSFEGVALTARHIEAWDRIISLVSLPRGA
jgi:4'-phosphopantetheinyl transferase EntD